MLLDEKDNEIHKLKGEVDRLKNENEDLKTKLRRMATVK